MNLNQVTLPAGDIELSARFYRDLGLRQIVATPDYARFECPEGESTFSIHKVPGVTPATGVVIYFECGQLDEQVAALQSKGLGFQQLPTDEPWLWREARLLDPHGNVICLFSAGKNRKNPPWRIGGPPPTTPS